ncbi:hypothetical protein CHH55_06160 [Niallia circulans]|uniref:Uncharacterized protein n=1 Tax=Niallia circulans TaxID=1397 RepID=A0A0J1IJM0_NIACI|nr:hypothetical protein ABW02_12380 [Niallia circulans]PAD24917.1 hypothetical protein CHH62_15105 [Niallia circulans]PAD88742.1 hypothetical protein CHH55_06160 [Niallia circulans]PAE13395.1 hypothetical protein CHI02_04825 [Niallia circulans]
MEIYRLKLGDVVIYKDAMSIFLLLKDEKNKKGLAVSRQGLFYFYEQRGWEKFFTVKQRGISLFVINFTTK